MGTRKKYSEHNLYALHGQEPHFDKITNEEHQCQCKSAIYHITSPCLHPPRGREVSQTSNPSIWCNGHSYADKWYDEWCGNQHP